MVDLEHLLAKFQPNRDFEYEGARHLTHVPSRGSWAYLNTIFAPAGSDIQAGKIDPLGLPQDIREFYRRYNGAHLLSGSVSIDGFFPDVYSYDRANRKKSYPYNIMDSNQQYFRDVVDADILLFASYRFDRSEVFVEKATGLIRCSVGSDLRQWRAIWPSFDVWVEEEIERLSGYFDEWGKQLVDDEVTLPGRR